MKTLQIFSAIFGILTCLNYALAQSPSNVTGNNENYVWEASSISENLSIAGSNNTININQTSGNTFSLNPSDNSVTWTINGLNNTVEAKGISVPSSLKWNATLEIIGSKNSLICDKLTLGSMYQAQAGHARFTMGSSSSEGVNILNVSNDIIFYAPDTNYSSANPSTSATFKGNNEVYASSIVIGKTPYGTGDCSVTITGGNNKFEVSSLQIGADSYITTNDDPYSKMNLIISGSAEKSLNFGSLKITGPSDASKTNPIGGVLTFIADANGFSTLNINTWDEMSGILELSFFAISGGVLNGQTIVSSSSDLSGIFDSLIEDSLLVKGLGANDEYEIYLSADLKSICVNLNIPEPAHFALIFGMVCTLAIAHKKRGKF